MEVRIDTYCEALDGTRTMINRAYFTMVGTDEQQHPVEVPGLIIEGVTQQIENEAAQKRAKLWKVRRHEGFNRNNFLLVYGLGQSYLNCICHRQLWPPA